MAFQLKARVWQGLQVFSDLSLTGLSFTVSCFHEYSDKKNTNKNLKTLAAVFVCCTEDIVQYCMILLQKSR